MKKSLILISQGDTNGIGLELFFRSVQKREINDEFLLVSSEYNVKNYIADIWDFPFKEEIVFIKHISEMKKDRINILDVCTSCDISKGKITAESGLSSFDSVRKCIDLVKSGQASAIVTLPICKESWYLNGIKYPGHTELFADMTNSGDNFTMILYSENFSVSLVTIHEPLRKVGELLTYEKIRKTIQHTLDFSVKTYGENARIAVSSFNPHCGEGGYLGNEEEIIRKAMEDFREQEKIFPELMPPDTVFYKVMKGQYNSVVCMYHDQALIPFKMMNFEKGVNVTYGTDIIRTSPDHGTAFDITGKGTADCTSFVNACLLAGKLIN